MREQSIKKRIRGQEGWRRGARSQARSQELPISTLLLA
jgi:hypothetical protein